MKEIGKEVSEKSIKKLVRKNDLNPEEASLVLAYYDSKLKEAEKVRVDKPRELNPLEVEDKGVNVIGAGASTLFVAGSFVGWYIGNPLVSISAIMGFPVVLFTLSFAEKFGGLRRSLSGKKHIQKLEEEITVNTLFHEMGEEEYQEIKKEILDKTANARNVINKLNPKEITNVEIRHYQEIF